MKKLLKIFVMALAIIQVSLTASAYNVVNLPENMTFSDALGIYNSSDITAITVSNVSNDSYVSLSEDQIDEFFSNAADLMVKRTINPTPFRGIAINIYSDNGVTSYLINSGMQIGTYGGENYICYKLSDVDTEKILYMQSLFYDEEYKSGGEEIHRNTSRDFLKLPNAPWAKTFANRAAAMSLLPYEFTSIYENNISREQFCILLGNLIAVKDNYATLEDFMFENGGAYLKNYFIDCTGADNSINILYALGIVSGKDDNMFDPYGTITREEAATLLCKVAEMYIGTDSEAPLYYDDAWSISEWAKSYVTWANEYGVMTGISDTEFAPQGEYTVEQAVATMVRLYNLIG